jgi:hypothetical protein
MMNKLKPGLPEREGGMKCIRPAPWQISTARKPLAATNWIQGKFMGGWEAAEQHRPMGVLATTFSTLHERRNDGPVGLGR